LTRAIASADAAAGRATPAGPLLASPSPELPDGIALANQMESVIRYGMKMTLDIDEKKVEEAMAEYGVKTKTEVIDLALRELLRTRAVARVLAAGGKFLRLPTNEELEGSYEQNHVLNPPRR
jgi:Arc/MetJ family transcription regulator